MTQEGILIKEMNYEKGYESGPQKCGMTTENQINYIVKDGRRYGLLGTKIASMSKILLSFRAVIFFGGLFSCSGKQAPTALFQYPRRMPHFYESFDVAYAEKLPYTLPKFEFTEDH